jgi:hypothetical protein
MASLLQPRQPFAVLDDTRLQALGSIKNRQNNGKTRFNQHGKLQLHSG